MEVSKQGYGHYVEGINNQDFYYFEENLKMVLDGCSDAKYSEVGTKLFVQVFSTLSDRLNVECFEENVKITFDKILESVKKWYGEQQMVEEFIMDNLLFTIVACFESEDSFIVKMFGDGFIITINSRDRVSYLRHSYGKTPPYFAYKYCGFEGNIFKDSNFKTFVFKKESFKKVGVATDGINPIAKNEELLGFDKLISTNLNSEYSASGVISSNISKFYDDITIII